MKSGSLIIPRLWLSDLSGPAGNWSWPFESKGGLMLGFMTVSLFPTAASVMVYGRATLDGAFVGPRASTFVGTANYHTALPPLPLKFRATPGPHTLGWATESGSTNSDTNDKAGVLLVEVL